MSKAGFIWLLRDMSNTRLIIFTQKSEICHKGVLETCTTTFITVLCSTLHTGIWTTVSLFIICLMHRICLHNTTKCIWLQCGSCSEDYNRLILDYLRAIPQLHRLFSIEGNVTCIPTAKQQQIPAQANALNNRTSLARQRSSKYVSLTIEDGVFRGDIKGQRRSLEE
jgi:hypothetical protein